MSTLAWHAVSFASYERKSCGNRRPPLPGPRPCHRQNLGRGELLHHVRAFGVEEAGELRLELLDAGCRECRPAGPSWPRRGWHLALEGNGWYSRLLRSPRELLAAGQLVPRALSSPTRTVAKAARNVPGPSEHDSHRLSLNQRRREHGVRSAVVRFGRRLFEQSVSERLSRP